MNLEMLTQNLLKATEEEHSHLTQLHMLQSIQSLHLSQAEEKEFSSNFCLSALD